MSWELATGCNEPSVSPEYLLLPLLTKTPITAWVGGGVAGCRAQRCWAGPPGRERSKERGARGRRRRMAGVGVGCFFDQITSALWVMVQMLRSGKPLTPAFKFVSVLASKLLL